MSHARKVGGKSVTDNGWGARDEDRAVVRVMWDFLSDKNFYFILYSKGSQR